ncbi:Na(+)/H(+) antiporter subunit F1 [Viridibacillus sp. FSL R5-0477]|uniref:Efflux system protein n=1 Tax=Viridibacillus arenosi FSL R5-213 TaxID=1227360 RepID=W4EMY1_9BACL|nr:MULTISPECIES: Na(+)/H(+) antiporter subunit F1 [Viridibacillus]ETT81933.1 efflux system protein [Viridibacillus arenosi FSL R5-213]OMC81486.1 Na(+)/H(+) antiporter subunit F [Viridibacillus sp. FSL H8-0123]OMC86972.1 Na(+)/H(+) antiporter subunit F [Viridibacillus sp. FSL H7-0596]OMC90534.1 Na(+)/H(+) antiporter subunit F [Viridibacillus arenosi]
MTYFIWAIIVIVTLSLVGIVYRLVKGPSVPDRVIALDSIGVSIISLVGLFSIFIKTSFYLDIILLLAILSFIGTVAFSKFIEKGEIIERDNSR